MGWVWMAQHLEWQAPVAVKLVELRRAEHLQPNSPPRSDSPLLQRFFNEARAAASIRSPHVVQILDHGVDPALRLPFIVMELLEGETLDQRLAREGRLSPEVGSNILGQVARALTRVHEANMVHRDLKPSNVFLVANDDDVVAKVLDFGIAKANAETELAPITVTGEQMGTPFYMSPEQVRGQRVIDLRADIWAFGVIAYECLTGARPFDGETLGVLSLRICVEPLPVPSRIAPLPAAFDAWFAKAVARDRTQTFGSAKEAAETLRQALGVRPLTSAASSGSVGFPSPTRTIRLEAALDTATAAVSSFPPPPQDRRRRHAALGVALVAVVGVVSAGSYSLLERRATHSDEASTTTTELPDSTAPDDVSPSNTGVNTQRTVPFAASDEALRGVSSSSAPAVATPRATPFPTSATSPVTASPPVTVTTSTAITPTDTATTTTHTATTPNDSVSPRKRRTTTPGTSAPPSEQPAPKSQRVESPLDLIESRL